MTINQKYINSFVRATEMGAYGASLFLGKDDKNAADQAAVDEMRNQLNKTNMRGRIVIGEGELDEAPMLYMGEKVGNMSGDEFDIAVDPLEGTNFAAKNLPNALSVLAATKKGNLLYAPETYMEKIAIGPNLPKDLVDLDFGIKKNIKILSDAKNLSPDKLTVCILKRPRHDNIVSILNSLKVKINFISDGDVSGVISVAGPNPSSDMYIGTGGGPEGVLAAAALSCLKCQMQTRLVFQNDYEKKKVMNIGIEDLYKKYSIDDMVRDDVIFCATGVTDGDIVSGVKHKDNTYQTETFVLHKESKTNKKIVNIFKK